jgi:hypothetical protein
LEDNGLLLLYMDELDELDARKARSSGGGEKGK